MMMMMMILMKRRRKMSMGSLLGITGVIPCPTTIWKSSEVSCPGPKEQNHCWVAPGRVGMEPVGDGACGGWIFSLSLTGRKEGLTSLSLQLLPEV